jgi:hypothetical protein
MRKKVMIAAYMIAALAIAGCVSAPVTSAYKIIFRDDFSGYKAGDNVVSKDLWSQMHVNGEATATVQPSRIKDVGNMLVVDAYDSVNMEKAHLFQTTVKTSDNFKLETRFRITKTGGWPQLQISPTGTLNGNGPLFWYLHLPADKTISYSYPSFTDIREKVSRNLGDGNWHTMILTGYGDVYTLYVDGASVGRINTAEIDDAKLAAGTIQIRVQSMIAHFDYFEVTEFDGISPFPSGGAFLEDFNKIKSLNESPYLIVGDPHLGNLAEDVKIGTFSREKALRLNAFSTDKTTSGNPYTEKAIIFSTKDKTPPNYKLEFRFLVGKTGGFPQIVAALADPAPLAAQSGSVPTFGYRRMPLAQDGHFAYVDRHYDATGSMARINFGEHSNFPANTWHTIAVTMYEGVYGLYINDNYIGSFRIEQPPEPGHITFRVQAMDLYLDYIQVSEYAGGEFDLGSPAGITVLPAAPGNIHPTTRALSFALDYTNRSDAEQTVSGSYVVLDPWGSAVQSGTVAPFTVPAAGEGSSSPIALNVTGNGIFDIQVSADIKESNPIAASKQFSRVFPVIPNRSGSPFASCLHFGLNYANVDIDPPLIALGGLGLARDEIFWGAVEPSRGVLSVPAKWDAIINNFIANGIEPLIILDYGNSLYDGGGIPYSKEGLDAWARYVTTVAQHFKGKVKNYEVWNEPNLDGFNPTKQSASVYTQMLKRTYTTLKGVDPNITVLGGALAGFAWDWLDGMMEAGAYGYMDALSVHPYSYPPSFEAANRLGDFNRAYNTINDPKYRGNGKRITIWATEFGWPTSTGFWGVSEELSAAMLVRSQALMLSLGYVDRLIWYNFQNKGNDRTEVEDNFGAILHPYDLNLPWGAKPSYVAQNAMSTLLHNATFRESNISDNHYQYLFRRADGQTVLVAWYNGLRQSSVSIPVGGSTCMVYDQYGNGVQTQVIGGRVTVTLSQNPIYITGTIPSVQNTGAALFEPARVNLSGKAGGMVSLDVTRLEAGQGLSGLYETRLPAGWTVHSGDLNFTAGSAKDTIRVDIPIGVKEGVYNVIIRAVSGTGRNVAAECRYQITISKEPVTVKLVPAFESGKWHIDMVIRNINPDTVRGNLRVTAPVSLTSGNIPFGPISSGEVQTIQIPVKTPGQDLQNAVVTLNFSDQSTFTVRQPISFLRAERATSPIQIDGTISSGEWANAQQVLLNKAADTRITGSWGGPDDLSATIYTKWDDEYLYLAVEVKDNIHYQSSRGTDIWNGDGIQFAFDPGRADVIGIRGFNEIGMALHNSGEVSIFRWVAAHGEAGDIPGNMMKTAIKRNEANKTTTYEAAIAWGLLLVPGVTAGNNSLFGFSLLINDNDGDGRRGWIQYMDGIGDRKNPALFGDLLLVGGTPAGSSR